LVISVAYARNKSYEKDANVTKEEATQWTFLFGKILWILVALMQPKNVVDSTSSNSSVFTVMLM